MRSRGPTPQARIVEKPWGREEWLVVGDRIVIKRLVVEAGHRFSLQYHEVKEEAWLFVRGRGKATIGGTEIDLAPGVVVHVEPRAVHRIEAEETLEFIEASTTELEDVVRVEDDYGRPERDSQ